ncbi:MAG TPA: valine--tRNA ligase [Candidatus Peribacteraceae bacterium]|nr:valine--tRNA ligase [Candidatus Peribacteraceae bacterium]
MLEKAYDPKAVEDRIYEMWEKSGAFKADNKSTKEPFTISMPPPNATGQLHLGHAVMLALEDIFIRFARMQGKEALWVPGTDHAAIATESVVIRQIQKDEKIPDPRAKLGREELVRRIAEFVEKSRGVIRSQVRKMGSSCDWSRERYTMDNALNRCVNEVFKKMYDDGLIYRGHRIVNWDPKLQTTVSDDEVEYKEEISPFYTFKYGPFEIATARPETKFGDKYVVMHPDDERYMKYKHGDTFEAEWINGPVRATVIKDDSIDMAFGTGVMTITPWHDHTDFEIAERHGLEKEQIIGFDGKLLEVAGEFAGMSIEEARPLIVEKLKSKGLLTKVDENYVHNKAVSQRGGGSIEPQIRLQWFIDVNKEVVKWPASAKATAGKKGQLMSLKQIMHAVVHHGDIAIIPERFDKTYFHWIDNLRDWCISRQIWWGHRVPVWYKGDDIHVGAQAPEGKGWEQDPDTLDTWFSSALWTWSTLVDPKLTEDMSLSLEDILKQSPDFQKFHPTSVMETGYDILFFWVARMILMTTYATGQIPFKTVYLHGLIRDRNGQKMSKSKPETMIDPLDIIPKYGADALRLSMIVGQSPGADSRLYEEKIAGYRNFINKLWNASRFVLMQCESAGIDPAEIENGKWKMENLSIADRALQSKMQTLVAEVSDGLTNYRLSETGEKLYSFVWDFYCDWYLELSKGNANIAVLVDALRTILVLLHPYCPFVTEELWSQMKPKNAGMLITHPWPTFNASRDEEAEAQMQILIDVITAIRKLRTDQGVEPKKDVSLIIQTSAHKDLLESQAEHIKRLGRVEDLTITSDKKTIDDAASAFLPDIDLYLPLAGLIDTEKEKASLTKEKAQLESYVKGIEAKLGNKQFVDKAPPALVEEQKARLSEAKEKLEKIGKRLASLS